MTYEEKVKAYEEIGIPYEGLLGKDFFRIVSLTVILTRGIRAREKSKASSKEVILSFYQPRNPLEANLVDNISIHADFQLRQPTADFDKYGTTKASEARDQIIKALTDYLPF